MIRTIIVDDEPSAVSVLASLLKKNCREDVEVLATTYSAFEAKDLIHSHQPDLVFLDIEMPGLTGLDIVRSFENPSFRTVFVTAHDNYAVEAFELSAVNYLLKPVGPESVVKTIIKIKEEITRNENNWREPIRKLESLLNKYANHYGNKVGIAMADKIVFIEVTEILYCEAHSAYTYVHMIDGRKLTASKPLYYFEVLLSNYRFFRIHHSFLINLNRVKEFQRNDGGYVILDNQTYLEVSRRKRSEFLDALNNFIV
jgi:two-component system LytT family response regulator